MATDLNGEQLNAKFKAKCFELGNLENGITSTLVKGKQWKSFNRGFPCVKGAQINFR